ncbi:hypothetical protein CTI12_AA307360 [Artemisia annua]|uniref:Uncharacterized protein n=1 Tax=Artemisia annua TaxID=35608 RepID=A0A2U1N4A8_ARTAN|nr:hypothetical protein CTI12_AA307360 [Artemisia annua]
MSTSISRVWMAAGVAVANGHTDQGYKRRSLINSFRHGKKKFTSSAGFDLRPIFGFSRANVNEGILGGGDMKTTQSDDSIRQVMYLNCWGQN